MGPDERLPIGPEVEEQLYRIGQEALANVVKHARASSATVYIAAKDDTVSIDVSDDGRGFDPAAVGPDHFGLRSIRGRAADLGAGSRSRARPAAAPSCGSRSPPSDDGPTNQTICTLVVDDYQVVPRVLWFLKGRSDRRPSTRAYGLQALDERARVAVEQGRSATMITVVCRCRRPCPLQLTAKLTANCSDSCCCAATSVDEDERSTCRDGRQRTALDGRGRVRSPLLYPLSYRGLWGAYPG
jgi:hypothetical protein